MGSISLLTAASVSQLISDTSFSTTVAGKTYNANVSYSDGEYTAAASNLSGASASGSTVQAAENNLTTRISILV
jgi:hypothetical protein